MTERGENRGSGRENKGENWIKGTTLKTKTERDGLRDEDNCPGDTCHSNNCPGRQMFLGDNYPKILCKSLCNYSVQVNQNNSYPTNISGY